ncbi:MAG: hypothetical protein AAGP08_07350, partial [Pseudomonadota bacterium]
LAELEAGAREGRSAPMAVLDDLPLFSAVPAAPSVAKPAPSPVLEKLETVHPDDLSPRDALDLIYALKRLSEGGS